MGMVSDQLLTPLLAYSAISDVLTSYERQNGTASYAIRGTATVKKYGAMSFEDLFTGDQPSSAASAYIVAPINFVLRNSFEDVDLEAVTLEVDASEQPRSATLERAWIDGTRVEARLHGHAQGAAAHLPRRAGDPVDVGADSTERPRQHLDDGDATAPG